MRDLVKGADLAIANFENPAPDAFRFHGSGTSFTANPALHRGPDERRHRLGLAGQQPHRRRRRAGMLQTIRNVREHGIASSGLGKNDKAAHKAAILDVQRREGRPARLRRHRAATHSGPTTPGSARPHREGARSADSAPRARRAPRWSSSCRTGASSTGRRRSRGQQKLARTRDDAGADMVIGNHAHWAGALELYKGKPIWYALGNFVFDQTWSIPTMEGITLELTFNGTDLVQAKMRPTSSSTAPSPTSSTRSATARRAVPGVPRLEGAARLVAGVRARRTH